MKNNKINGSARFGFAATALLSLLACNGAHAADAPTPPAGTGGVVTSVDGKRTYEAAPGMTTLAVRFVTYTKDGKPVLTEEQANEVITKMNKVVAKCKIRYMMDEYMPVNPAEKGLDYGASQMGDMDKARTAFDTDKALVVTSTGAWDASMAPANAWAAMPGETPSGVVMESSVADNANIVAHELGHYLSLDHFSDQANLMNPVIYSTSNELTDSQCADMQETAKTVRAGALR